MSIASARPILNSLSEQRLGQLRTIGEVLTIAGIATVLRCYAVSQQPLWVDEAVTINYAGFSLYELWLTPVDVNTPLFYTLAKFMLLFGDSEVVLRLGSVIAGTLAVPVMYAIGWTLAGRTAAVGASLFLATAATHVEYSQEARCYALLFLALSISVLGLIQFMKRVRKSGDAPLRAGELRAYSLYIIGAVLALYSHYTSVFWLASANGVLLVFWVTHGGVSRRKVLSYLAGNLAILVLWAPGAWVFVQLLHAQLFQWLTQPSFEAAVSTIMTLHSFEYVWRAQPLPNLALGAVIAIGLVVTWRRSAALGAILLCVIIVSPCLMWLAGFLKPTFMLRTILWGLIGSSACVGVALSILRTPLRSYAVLTALVLANTLSTWTFYEVSKKENWDEAAEFVRQQTAAGDTIVLCNQPIAAPLEYYLAASGTARTFVVYSSSRRDFTRLLPASIQPDRPRTEQIFEAFQLTRAFPPTPAEDLRGHPRLDPNLVRVSSLDARELPGTKWAVSSHCSHEMQSEMLRRLGGVIPSQVRQWTGYRISIFQLE